MTDPRADALRAGYAPVARAYRDQIGDELVDKPLDRAFLAAFAERCDGRVLEVGCGPGHVAKFLAEQGAAIEGLDLSPAMIEQARAAYPDLAFRTGDMFALPFEDGALGAIVAFYAIVHVPSAELGAPFTEWHRALKPGGLCAIAFHIGTSSDQHVHVDELCGVPTSLEFVMHSPEAVVTALTAAGFVIEARLDRAPYPDVEHPSQRCYLLARRNR